MKKIKFITAIYSDLYGTELGGRPNRYHHYRWSLLSLLKMTDADFVCYTSDREYNDIKSFFYDNHKINEDKLRIIVFDLNQNKYNKLIKKYKNIEQIKKGDRCLEIQYMKFVWFTFEDMSYDYYFWIDSGLSHCGLIPNKHLSLLGSHYRGYYESQLFNNKFLQNLISNTGDKFTIIGKENHRNFWSSTVNVSHFDKYDNSIHIIGGLFGGKKEIYSEITNLFEKYLYQVTESDNRLYHEEDIMTLMFRNHETLFNRFHFDTWWHENERIAGLDIQKHISENKSFYKILEELNV